MSRRPLEGSNSSRRHRRAQWLRDAGRLKVANLWYRPEEIAEQTCADAEAKRRRRAARRAQS